MFDSGLFIFSRPAVSVDRGSVLLGPRMSLAENERYVIVRNCPWTFFDSGLLVCSRPAASVDRGPVLLGPGGYLSSTVTSCDCNDLCMRLLLSKKFGQQIENGPSGRG